MNYYLDKFESIIPKMQKEAIDYFSASNVYSSESLSGDKLFNPYYVSDEYDIVDSDKYNKMQTSLSSDLSVLFSHGNYVDTILKRIKEQVSKEIELVNTNIDKAYANLDQKRFQITRNILGFSDVFYDSFRDNSNIEPDDSPLYSGNYKIATVDRRNNRLCVPCSNAFEFTVSNSGKKLVSADIIDRRGVSIGPMNSVHNVKHIIDNSEDTYWEEFIMTDEPIGVDYNFDQNPLDKISKSAVSVVHIDLKGFKSFNEIRLKPFCEFPVFVVGMYGVIKQQNNITISANIVSNNIAGKNVINPCYLDSSESFHFPQVHATGIILILAQSHYKRSSFRLRKGKRENYEIFNTIYANASLGTIDYSEFKTDADLLKTAQNIAKTMVHENTGVPWVGDTENQYEYFSKYEYTYGLYDINIKYNSYEDSAEFISKPIKANKSIGQIALYSDNTVLSPTAGTIEYDILIGDNCTPVPILPINHDVIYEVITSERIEEYEGDEMYYLRFPICDSVDFTFVKLHTVGSLSSESQVIPLFWDRIKKKNCIVAETLDMDENCYVLEYPYDRTSSTTPRMQTVKGWSNKYIDFMHKFLNVNSVDASEDITVFDKTSMSITLSSAPYIDYNKMNNKNADYNNGAYTPIIITIQNSAIEFYNSISSSIETAKTVFQYIDGVSDDTRPHTYNCTDYKTREIEALTAYEGVGKNTDSSITTGDNYKIYYQQYGNKIYFNTDLSGCTINVKYNKLADTVRLRAVIRSTVPGPGDPPPQINSYALLFNYLDLSSIYEYSTEEYGLGSSGESYDSGSETSIRVDSVLSNVSDEYNTVANTGINNSSLNYATKAFNVYNTGNINTRYKVGFRIINQLYSDSSGDMEWECVVKILNTTETVTWKAVNNGYPSNTAWHEFTTTDKLFAGYNAPLSINIRPKCSAMTCNLKEAKILVEFQLTSEDDVSYNKCVRRGPSYVIYVKGQ